MKAKLWFRCAVVFDPVCPKLLTPCAISWEAKYRDIDLVIERPLKGEELVKRMKGWVTVDPYEVIDIVNEYGKFKINENGELYILLNDDSNFSPLKEKLHERFKEEIILEPL